MKKFTAIPSARSLRLSLFALSLIALLVGSAAWNGVEVSANHPVLVEGNCDSPVPGTTIVSPGTCGDFDGDGRIGTAEDTDGADRIFGTLGAALGPGTGAAAGTGANYNGTIIIVSSGRFSEPSLLIGNPDGVRAGGTASPGNVTIEAAPGVMADIDAVQQGDPAGGNNTRQGTNAMLVNYGPAFSDRVITLRNLTFRNWFEGVGITGFCNVLIDNCRFENNLKAGVVANNYVNVVITRSQFEANGHRIGGPSSTPSPGDGVSMEGSSANMKIADSTFTNNAGAGIRNGTGEAQRLTLYRVGTYFNGTDIVGPFTVSPNPNSSN